MTASEDHARICPTRTNGAEVLFTHKVTVEQCQDRQRGRYHKCYTCAFNNGWVASNGLPEQPAPKPKAKPARRRTRERAAVR